MAESTLNEYLASQDDLVREAGLALPHQFSHCTYPLGYLRLFIYVQRARNRAEFAQHAQSRVTHNTNKWNSHPCGLETTVHQPNEDNRYGQNFQALFCRCSRTYDAQKEREAMIQCLSCEDWFHESCCNLRERPSSREPTPEPERVKEDVPPTSNANEPHEDDDADSEASFSDLPPPLVSASDYDSFVCGSCVSKIKVLQKYAGTPGTIMVVRDTPDSQWRRVGDRVNDEQPPVNITDEAHPSNVGMKRRLSPSEDTRELKRAKGPSNEGDSSKSRPCLAPKPNPVASNIYQQISSGSTALGHGDLFLTDGFRERWCRCENCLVSLENHRYLTEEEETYEPPEDPDSGLSLEELGMRALSRLPRDRAIDGIQAFNTMRDGLRSFLQPFAEEGKVVNETDVRDFFTAFTEAKKKGLDL